MTLFCFSVRASRWAWLVPGLGVLALALMAACHSAPAALAGVPEGVAVLDSALRTALATETAETLPPLSAGRGRVPITDCKSLLRQLKAGLDLGEQREQSDFTAWQSCLATAVVREARPGHAAALSSPPLGEQLFRSLDLSTVPTVLAQRRPAEHYRFSDFSFQTQALQANLVDLVGNNFHHQLNVLAIGDFRGQGHASVLARFTENALNGSYSSSQLLLLDQQAGGTWTSSDALLLLMGPVAR